MSFELEFEYHGFGQWTAESRFSDDEDLPFVYEIIVTESGKFSLENSDDYLVERCRVLIFSTLHAAKTECLYCENRR
jgi:hypothetical protein